MFEMHESMALSLLEAIRNGDQDLAKWIIRHKRYSNLDRQSSKKDGTALFWCCCRGYVELVHLLLLHGADIHKSTAWGATPLHACADHDHAEIIVLLVEFGARVNQQTVNGDTACHLAAYRGYRECVQRLAERGASVEMRNNKQHTPIQEAYVRGHSDTYTYLLSVQKLVSKHHTLPKENVAQVPVPKHTPTPPPCDFYRRLSLRDTGNIPSTGSEWGTSTTSHSIVMKSDPNSNIAVPYKGSGKQNAVGVLRVNYRNISRSEIDSDSDFSSNSTGSSMLNDLSSVNTSVVSTVPSVMSFKNI